jgi:hypothetical protein
MATRSIVTSQPDVECDVCERRLLRGEQPDVFLAAGRRHLVCELCAPRAVQEGWLRETGGQAGDQPATRPRRRLSLFERLPVPFRVRQVASAPNGASEAAQPSYDGAQAPYDFLDGHGGAVTVPVPALAPEPGLAATAAPDSQLERAVAAFNISEHPRRVAGVGRALGPPAVSVRHSEHAPSVATIVIAWELCWYRYQVDLDQTPPAALVVAQGTELGELMREECVANALADESGTLLLSDAHAGAR